MKPSIFVMIPSYRDPECKYTIDDCLKKSSKKFNINIGILWQHDDNEHHMLPSFYGNIKNMYVKHDESKGCCWARNQLHTKLYAGEDYILSIDSHTRFVENWDEILISLYKNLRGKRVISTYPCGYEPPDKIVSNYPIKIQAHGRNKEGLPYLSPTRSGNVPHINYFIAGGFLFGQGKMFEDVPYDPNIFFFGEEVSLSLRFYTSGYDIWNPAKVILYHYYVRKDSPRHWTDNTQTEHVKFRQDSVERVMQLMGLKATTLDFGIYGLGKERTLSDYLSKTNMNNLPII